jgi:hypothetical protein
MSAHTKGPWAVDGEGAHVASVSRAADITAPRVSTHDRPNDERIAADARLISAAPEMLDALKAVELHGYFGVEHIVLAAIAKAEGRA